MDEQQQEQLHSAITQVATLAVLTVLMADFAARNGTEGLRSALASTKAVLPALFEAKGWNESAETTAYAQAAVEATFAHFEAILNQFEG
jgi:hypothetical protein